MKNIFLIIVLGVFCSCDNGHLKTYRVALTDTNNKCDTVNYYFHDENYDLSGGFGCMLSLRNGCLCKQFGASGHNEIMCGVKEYKLISISETPKSVEIFVVKENKVLK